MPIDENRKSRSIFTQIAFSVTLFIFIIEAIIFYFSYIGQERKLNSLKQSLAADVIVQTGRTYDEIHPNVLSEADIQRRLDRFTWNIFWLTVAISIFVTLGTLLVFYWIAGRHLNKLINAERQSTHDNIVTIPKEEIPNNEIGELIVAREKHLQEIRSYQDSLEEKLEEAKAKLVHSAKLSTIGQLSASIAHDLNNPLQMVMSATDIIRIESKDTRLEEEAEAIEMATKRLLDLSQRLTGFSRNEFNTESCFDLKAIAEEALLFVKSKLIEHDVKVENKIKNGIEVRGDEGAFSQVFTNLISNAIDAMANSPERKLTLEGYSSGPCWFFFVQDTGSGIPKDLQKNIFESFVTTKSKGSGTGLGLSNCVTIVNLHGGLIELTESSEHGTKFMVEIPQHVTEELAS